jgi:hypothetical protein
MIPNKSEQLKMLHIYFSIDLSRKLYLTYLLLSIFLSIAMSDAERILNFNDKTEPIITIIKKIYFNGKEILNR